jgi:large-conductance mechanosensitive channel
MSFATLSTSALVWLATAATPSPSPTPGEFTGDVNIVTPGIIGFIVTFLIAVATVFLIIDMTRRVRRVRYRDQVRAELEAERETETDGPPSTGSRAPGD